MAGRRDDKTEKPTPKRKREARRRGQVARSTDLTGWMGMLVASLVLPVLLRSGSKRMVALMAQGSTVMSHPSPAAALGLLGAGFEDLLVLVLPTAGALALTSLLANVAQVGLLFSPEAAKPKLSRVSPKAGLKRIFSANSLWELVKQLLKLGLLFFLAFQVVRTLALQVVPSAPVDMGPMISLAGNSIMKMVRDIALVGLALGALDYGVQRRRVNQSLKMSKQEVKEEARKSEGDPLIRGAIRRKQFSMSRLRMMAAVAGADVVVTNPTHYAVALRYEAGRGHAPRLVAKGAGPIALRIRDEAHRHHVPVVEDPPLARAIYGACELDAQIPEQLYVAVARLLAFVFTLPQIVRRSGVVQRRPTSALVA